MKRFSVWGKGEKIGRRGKGKGESLWTNIWDCRSMAPAVHQILKQAPIGENTDCWQVWFTSLFWSTHGTWFDLNNRLQTGPLIFNMATSGAWLISFLAAMNVPASEGKSRRPETISLVVHFSEVWKCGKVWQSYDNVILFPCYDPFVILYLVLHFSKVWKCGIVWQSKDNVILFP